MVTCAHSGGSDGVAVAVCVVGADRPDFYPIFRHCFQACDYGGAARHGGADGGSASDGFNGDLVAYGGGGALV